MNRKSICERQHGTKSGQDTAIVKSIFFMNATLPIVVESNFESNLLTRNYGKKRKIEQYYVIGANGSSIILPLPNIVLNIGALINDP
jgi:hypothetical protein